MEWFVNENDEIYNKDLNGGWVCIPNWYGFSFSAYPVGFPHYQKKNLKNQKIINKIKPLGQKTSWDP